MAHGDLKPENLFLDENKNLKIGDFGLSKEYIEGEKIKTTKCSPCYVAPEILKGKKFFGLNADIWSSGIVLFAMLCG